MTVGTTYGKYFLLKKLASGGMGEIFLARQQGPAGFEKVVVIKRILSHLTDNVDYLESFLMEARLQAKMSHSSIVQIFDLGQVEDDTSFYLAMEYVHGKSLYEVISRLKQRNQVLPPNLAAQIIERAADGLSYAHNLNDSAGRCLNIVHRDISPHNVLVSYQGEVKLIDFGIAKSEINSVKTEAGTIKGKFYYMSPEQSAARPLDKRSDIFSLGILLYEALTGDNPFYRTNVVMALEAIQREDPTPVSYMRPDLASFDRVVGKALAKDPDDRYSDAAELKDELTLARAQLPPNSEKLGPLLQTLFKDKVEQENRILVDTDSSSLPALERSNRLAIGRTGSEPKPIPGTGSGPRTRPGSEPKPAPGVGSGPKQRLGSEPKPAPGTGSGPKRLTSEPKPVPRTSSGPKPIPKTGSGPKPLPLGPESEDAEAFEDGAPTLGMHGGLITRTVISPGEEENFVENQETRVLDSLDAPDASPPTKVLEPLDVPNAPGQEEAEPEPITDGHRKPEVLEADAATLARMRPSRMPLYALGGLLAAGLLGTGGYFAFSDRGGSNAARIDPLKPVVDDEAKKAAAARAAEETKKAEEAKQTAEKKAAEDAKKDEEARMAAEAKTAQDTKKSEAARKTEEARAATEAKAEAKKAEDAKKAEEGKAKAEAKKAEDAKKAEEARAAAEVKKAEAARKAEEAKAAAEVKKAEATKKAEEAKAADKTKVGSAAATLGTLVLHVTPAATLKLNGRTVGEKVTLPGAAGNIDAASDQLPLKLRLAYTAEAVELQSEPWAIVYVNGISKGKTPVEIPLDNETRRIELKRPGLDQPVTLMMRFNKP